MSRSLGFTEVRDFGMRTATPATSWPKRERLRKQSGDIAYFNDFEIFVEKMEKEELKRGARRPGAESIRTFLDSEAGLPQLPS
jgi:hypothetical protein